MTPSRFPSTFRWWALVFTVCASLAGAALGAPAQGTSTDNTFLCLSVRAWVDGVSDLVIQPQTVFWQNRENGKPGTPHDHLVAEVPTLLDGRPWLPRWQGETSDRLKTAHFPATFAGLAFALGKTEARGAVEVVEAANQQVVVRFTDRPNDATWYHMWLVAAAADLKPFADAVAETLSRAAAGDTDAAQEAAERVRTSLVETKVPGAVRERALAKVVTYAVEACRAVDFDVARSLVHLAAAVDPNDRAVTDLERWLDKAAEPVFTDDFDEPGLGPWGAVEGDWRVSGGKLECVINRQHGRVVLQGTTARDFALAFDAVSVKPFTVRFGTLFRAAKNGCFGFFLCDAHNQVVGGEIHAFTSEPVGSPHDPVGIQYAWGGFRYPVEPVRRYRMAMRAAGPLAECYVDGAIVARVHDRRPAPGQLGFYVFEGGCRFDNVRVYKPLAPPRIPPALAKTPLAKVVVTPIR